MRASNTIACIDNLEIVDFPLHTGEAFRNVVSIHHHYHHTLLWRHLPLGVAAQSAIFAREAVIIT